MDINNAWNTNIFYCTPATSFFKITWHNHIKWDLNRDFLNQHYFFSNATRYMPQSWVYWLNGQNTKLFSLIKWKILFDSSKLIYQLLDHFMMCHMYGTLLVMWSQHFILMNWKCFSVNKAVFTNLKICTFNQSIRLLFWHFIPK